MQIRAHGNRKRECVYEEPTSADPKALSERKWSPGEKKKSDCLSGPVPVSDVVNMSKKTTTTT